MIGQINSYFFEYCIQYYKSVIYYDLFQLLYNQVVKIPYNLYIFKNFMHIPSIFTIQICLLYVCDQYSLHIMKCLMYNN